MSYKLFMPLKTGGERLTMLALSLIVALFLLTFLPLLNVGYTTNDETHLYYYYSYSLENFPLEFLNSFRIGVFMFLKFARHSLPSLLLSPFVGLLGAVYHDVLAMRLLSIVAHAVSISLFYAFLRLLSRSVRVAYLGVILFLVLIQNSWDHNLLVSYFQHLVYFAFMLASLILFVKYLRGKSGVLLLFSVLLYFFSIAYETLFVYLPVFMVLSWIESFHGPESGLSVRLQKAVFDVRYFLIVSAVYLAVYFGFSNGAFGLPDAARTPDSYTGYVVNAQVSAVRGILETILCHGVSSFPGFIGLAYHKFVANYSVFRNFYGGHTLLLLLVFAWVGKAVLAGAASFKLLKTITREDVSCFPAFYAILLGFYLIFAPGVPVALVQKYQNWVAIGVLGFTNTYFSFYGVIFLITAVLVYLTVEVSTRFIKFRYLFLVLFSLGISAICLFTDYSNAAFTNAQSQSGMKWKSVNSFLASDGYKALPSDSVIYAPSLFEYISIMRIFPQYWTDYFAYRSGETYRILDNSLITRKFCENPRVVFDKPGGRNIHVIGDYNELVEFMGKKRTANLYVLTYTRSPDTGKAIVLSQKAISDIVRSNVRRGGRTGN